MPGLIPEGCISVSVAEKSLFYGPACVLTEALCCKIFLQLSYYIGGTFSSLSILHQMVKSGTQICSVEKKKINNEHTLIKATYAIKCTWLDSNADDSKMRMKCHLNCPKENYFLHTDMHIH